MKCGDCIAQLIMEKISSFSIEQCTKLNKTSRGIRGLGSTGVQALPAEEEDDTIDMEDDEALKLRFWWCAGSPIEQRLNIEAYKYQYGNQS